MSKISIKTDFVDGEKLFAQQLNNNFLVIQAGINANEENLQQVIDQAILELDNELEEITANRGWDWNGGDRVTFFKGTTSQVNAQEIKDGQLLYNTDSGETALDDNGTRIVTGSGNVVSISENEPTNPSTKIWIKPSKIVRYAASYVTNNMLGEDTDKAPSVKAVKDYVEGPNIVVDTEVKLNYKYNGYDVYFKRVTIDSFPNATTKTVNTNINATLIKGEIYMDDGNSYILLPYVSLSGTTANMVSGSIKKDCSIITLASGVDRSSLSGFADIYYIKDEEE